MDELIGGKVKATIGIVIDEDFKTQLISALS
jgi:hypothetical protein